MIKVLSKANILGVLFLMATNSGAAETAITAVPTGWMLENGVGGIINAYYTGTVCAEGRLRLQTGVTEQDKNRFWSTIMAAKVSNLTVTVFYDPNLADCQLTRFRLHPN